MPTVEITTTPLGREQKRDIACSVADAITKLGIPERLVTVIFRPVEADDYAVERGTFTGLDSGTPAPAFGWVAITAGGFSQETKQSLACEVAEALISAGVPEPAITLIYHDVTGADVFVGSGRSPFQS
jgi:phenylpyruvate tautomerase PptA (4-oxalocrotonate tautomerase family)